MATWMAGTMLAAGMLVGLAVIPVLRRWTWVGDLAALALPAGCLVLAAALVAVSVSGGPAWAMAATFGLLVGSSITIALPRRRIALPGPGGGLLLASVNLQFDSGDPLATVQSAIDAGAEVLVVSEVTTHTDRLLAPAFPHRIITNQALRERDNGVAVYSRVPIVELAALPRFGREALRIHVLGPDPFVLYAVHLPRPVIHHDGSPGLLSLVEHRRAVRRLDEVLRAEVEPVVIAGDLNLSDRMHGYHVLRAARLDAMRTASAKTTYVGRLHWRLLLLRIDHLFLPPEWTASEADTFSIRGSDHRGIRARIAPRR